MQLSATNRVLASGVALATAGTLIAPAVAVTTPAATTRLAGELQHRTIALAATLGNEDIWGTAEQNFDHVMDLIKADPDPIGHVVGDIATGYFDLIKEKLDDFAHGVEGIWSGYRNAIGLEQLIPLVQELEADGNSTEAFNQINQFVLFTMQNLFQPWFSVEDRGPDGEHLGTFSDGILNIPASITRHIADLQDAFADYNFWKHAAEALMSPFISMQFALADANNPDLPAGDTAQDPLDAFLNGYIPWDAAAGHVETHRPLVGLLTEGGPIDYFFRQVPDQIAGFLDGTIHGIPDEDGGLLDGGLGGEAGSAAADTFDLGV